MQKMGNLVCLCALAAVNMCGMNSKEEESARFHHHERLFCFFQYLMILFVYVPSFCVPCLNLEAL